MPATGMMVGFLAGMLGFALLSQGKEEEALVIGEESGDSDDLEVNNYQQESGRLLRTPLLCPTCRKQKRFREIKPRVFECTKCHRTLDLRT